MGMSFFKGLKLCTFFLLHSMKESSSMIQQIFTYQPPLEAEAGGSPASGLQTAVPRLRVGFPDRANVDTSRAHFPLSPEPNEIADTHSFLNLQEQLDFLCISPVTGKSTR